MAKILLIDDTTDLLRFLQDKLEQRGHQVKCLERAEGGVDVLKRGEFDLVVVDEKMPGGMNGSEFLKVLRGKGVGIPAILMTGLAKGALEQPMKELDALVVGKPAGGYEEVWKDLEPILDLALQAETEIVASISHAVKVALKAGKTNLVPYLRWLLDHELRTRVRPVFNSNRKEATRILGVPAAQFMEEKPPNASALSIQTEALVVIANNSQLSVDEIAKQLSCSRSTLYRDKLIRAALKARNASSYRVPRGKKTADGDVEAFDDDE